MNTVISVRVDQAVKDSATEVADSIGIKLGTLINAFLRQVAVTRKVEFVAPEPMTPQLEKLIADVEAEIEKGQTSQTYSDVNNFLKDLKT